MNDDIEPVVRLELSIFEALAVYMLLVQNEAQVLLTIQTRALHEQGHGGLKQPALTTQRALAKVKEGVDVALIECKRRYPRQTVTADDPVEE